MPNQQEIDKVVHLLAPEMPAYKFWLDHEDNLNITYGEETITISAQLLEELASQRMTAERIATITDHLRRQVRHQCAKLFANRWENETDDELLSTRQHVLRKTLEDIEKGKAEYTPQQIENYYIEMMQITDRIMQRASDRWDNPYPPNDDLTPS